MRIRGRSLNLPARGRAAIIAGALSAIALAGALAAASGAATYAKPTSCSGTPAKPGVLSGVVNGNVVVNGACFVDAGNATVHGSLTVAKGGAIAAIFAHNDKTHSGTSNLTVTGDVIVDSGATAFLGCKASSSPCKDDSTKHPTLSNKITIGGNVVSTGALGVIIHSTKVAGSIAWSGGGGGLKCVPVGVFKVAKSPPFYDMEDSSVTGSLTIKDITGCWLGVLRDRIGKSLTLTGNKMADPDAMEIGDNHIGGNLACTGNTKVWDTSDSTSKLYPRVLKRNSVTGTRSGQCVTATATTNATTLPGGPF